MNAERRRLPVERSPVTVEVPILGSVNRGSMKKVKVPHYEEARAYLYNFPLPPTSLPGQGDAVGSFLEAIGPMPVLKPEEEIALFYLRDQAREKLSKPKGGTGVTAEDKEYASGVLARVVEIVTITNLKLVVATARRFGVNGYPMEHKIQDAMFGLAHAIKKFDYKKGTKFSTYCTYWLLQKMQRKVSENQGPISLPSRTWQAVHRYRTRIRDTEDRELTRAEVEDDLNMPYDTYLLLVQAATTLSLDAPRFDEEDTTYDYVPDNTSAGGESDVDSKMVVQEFTKRIAELKLPPDQDTVILDLIRCVWDGSEETGKQRAKRLGLPYNTYRSSLAKARKTLGNTNLPDILKGLD
jgi:RNA polymerase primary sigma factor